MSRAPAVEVEHVAKRYGNTVAVDDVSLSVQHGETLGILGINGAGKSTTVEMIAGLRSPDDGHVRVLGLDPRRDRAALRQVLGVQLQDAQLHGALTVTELIRLYRSFYPDPRSTQELLDLVELGHQRHTRFERLSGGQQQRLSVALALAGRPRVVILDELTTGLDPAARRRMWRTLEHLREDGVTILLVSHTMEEVEQLCDRIVLLEAGCVLTTDSPAEVVARAGTSTLDEAFVQLTGHDLEVAE
ncbi:ABC transporter ATP-binding protein [Brachybacterium sacelli]|uniref:ABC-2 type transport system ATP-binding protein n=1 Tax=Brachybacterium sacelli TaxID=173364 RepID=A0ABS4X1E4_9MICO|nr:ABC transporter ATP-binding protein [Brachybacterium sacelli]MBP2382058.1 ABC-2 type transport system ATP-binding protein [Brachybacterium sacelli]